jgi:hypothetical protein
LKAVEKWEEGGKGRVFKGTEQTKVKHTHSGHISRYLLNINLNVNNENQDCKIGTVCVCVGGVVLVGRGG